MAQKAVDIVGWPTVNKSGSSLVRELPRYLVLEPVLAPN
jgi:hypothetical protein